MNKFQSCALLLLLTLVDWFTLHSSLLQAVALPRSTGVACTVAVRPCPQACLPPGPWAAARWTVQRRQAPAARYAGRSRRPVCRPVPCARSRERGGGPCPCRCGARALRRCPRPCGSARASTRSTSGGGRRRGTNRRRRRRLAGHRSGRRGWAGYGGGGSGSGSGRLGRWGRG